MKAVINGKRYNTETAEEVGEYQNALGYNDFRHIEESLYKTKKGAFFLAGSGGPMTKYSQAVGDMTGGGSGIIPLTKEEARTWCENHEIDCDVIDEHFKDILEDA